MKGRVNLTPAGYISMVIDWNKLVNEPFEEGRAMEAFASADAIISELIEDCLKGVYNDTKCRDLIDEIHSLRNKTHFETAVMLEILKSKTIIDESLYGRIISFKGARNLVVHSQEGEYAFVLRKSSKKFANQKELDEQVFTESKKMLTLAYDIFNELINLTNKIETNKDYYFSEEFYKKNPSETRATKSK
jgi:hypothetical protein